MIRDETKRVRQPAAWLLLSGAAISVVLGLAAMLSNTWAEAVNPAGLAVSAAGGMSGPSFADRSVVASHVFTAIPVTALAVAAVILATHLGEKVSQARTITLTAVGVQAVALGLGVITWLVSLSVPHGSAKLTLLLDGAVGVLAASAGLFFSVVTLRSRELQAAAAQSGRKASRAGRQQAAGYPGYSYGQAGYGPQGYPAGSYQQAQQSGSQSAAGQTAQYETAAGQQYGSAATQQYGSAGTQQYGQAQGGYGQQSYGSYGQQSYPAGYAQSGYQQGYDAGYGQQQSYGQGYTSYPQPGYGQQAQPSADAYQQRASESYQQETYQQQGTDAYQQQGTDAYQQRASDSYQQRGSESYQPGADSYQQYYQQAGQQPTERSVADNSQSGHGHADGES